MLTKKGQFSALPEAQKFHYTECTLSVIPRALLKNYELTACVGALRNHYMAVFSVPYTQGHSSHGKSPSSPPQPIGMCTALSRAQSPAGVCTVGTAAQSDIQPNSLLC